jgi:hypothetical protein
MSANYYLDQTCKALVSESKEYIEAVKLTEIVHFFAHACTIDNKRKPDKIEADYYTARSEAAIIIKQIIHAINSDNNKEFRRKGDYHKSGIRKAIKKFENDTVQINNDILNKIKQNKNLEQINLSDQERKESVSKLMSLLDNLNYNDEVNEAIKNTYNNNLNLNFSLENKKNYLEKEISVQQTINFENEISLTDNNLKFENEISVKTNHNKNETNNNNLLNITTKSYQIKDIGEYSNIFFNDQTSNIFEQNILYDSYLMKKTNRSNDIGIYQPETNRFLLLQKQNYVTNIEIISKNFNNLTIENIRIKNKYLFQNIINVILDFILFKPKQYTTSFKAKLDFFKNNESDFNNIINSLKNFEKIISYTENQFTEIKTKKEIYDIFNQLFFRNQYEILDYCYNLPKFEEALDLVQKINAGHPELFNNYLEIILSITDEQHLKFKNYLNKCSF